MGGNLFYNVMHQDGLGLQETRVGAGRLVQSAGFISPYCRRGARGGGWVTATLGGGEAELRGRCGTTPPTEPSVGRALWEGHHTGEEGRQEERVASSWEDVLVSRIFPQAVAILNLPPPAACIESEEHCSSAISLTYLCC